MGTQAPSGDANPQGQCGDRGWITHKGKRAERRGLQILLVTKNGAEFKFSQAPITCMEATLV